MLFTERGRGLTEEKASRPALPHVWMWTGVTQQDTAQTEAPAPRDGSPRRKLDAGRGAPPHVPEQPAGLCRAENHYSPLHEQHATACPELCQGRSPGPPWPPTPTQLDFVEARGHRWDMATSTWPWGHVRVWGGCLPRGQDERSITLKRNSNLPFPLISLLTAQSKYFYKSGISLPICISDVW